MPSLRLTRKCFTCAEDVCMYVTTVACNTGIYTSVKPFSKVYHDCMAITAFHLSCFINLRALKSH